jgi:hypothetical protein
MIQSGLVKSVLVSLIIGGLALTGCSSRFYLTESEVTAYHENVRTETRANNLLSSLNGKTVNLDFQMRGGRPVIINSNLVDTLRAIPNLFVLEQLFRQIQLDRLSTQIEESLEGWIIDSLYLLSKGTDTRIRINPLQQVSVTFLSAPTVSYDSSQQKINFSIRVRLNVRGTLNVRRLDGLLRDVLGWLITDGSYPITLVINNFVITGDFRLLRGAGSRLYARFFPQPGSVGVQGNLPSDIRNGARELSRQKFGAPVHATYPLIFDYFALSNFRLNTDNELELNYRPQPESNAPDVHVVGVGEDYKIYHTVGRAGHWRPYEALPFSGRYLSPVALTSSGPAQLELLTVTGGEFSHASWREGRWQNLYTSDSGNGTQFGPFEGFKPALVATAPGQIEAVLKGRDGRLYHIRRINGNWLVPAEVPIHPARNIGNPRHQVAVQSGNKIVLVFISDVQRIWCMLFDLETGYWDYPLEIQAPDVFYPPALAADGDEGRVHLVYTTSTGRVFHRELTAPVQNITATTTVGLSIGPLTDLGGILTTGPSVICSGLGVLHVVGRGQNNRLWHNHYRSPRTTSSSGPIDGRWVNPGWQGWEEVSEQFFGSLFAAAINSDPIGIAASRQGQVHIVARQRGGSQRLIHNSFDNSRYGWAPWKAVHWRGAWRMAARKFEGYPALAILDRQLHLVSRNQSGYLIHGTTANDHIADFRQVSNTLHPFRPDPVLVSAAPGTVDILFPGLSGRVEHVRWINRSFYRRSTLPGAGNTAFNTPIAAVNLANGNIEAVAVGQNRMLYHWRFLNGQWQPPLLVGGPVNSLPALVNVGAGRLALLAVGQDLKLHRWRFSDGQWLDFGIIRTNFTVNEVLFGPTAVSSWGDGTVDLVMVEDTSGAVHHYRLLGSDQPPGRGFASISRSVTRIGGSATETPILTARGPNDLHLLIRGADGRVYANQTQLRPVPSHTGFRRFLPRWILGSRRVALTWKGFQPVSQKRSLLVGPAARLGDGELVVAATDDQSGRIYMTRYLGHRWSMFMPLVKQLLPERQSPPFSRPALITQ